MARVRRVDGPFSALTLLFLYLICLTPFATGLMAEYGPAKAMKAYSLLVASTGAVQALLWSYAAFFRPLLNPAIGRSERWITLAAFCLMPAAFCLAGLLVRPGAAPLALIPIALMGIVLGQFRRRLKPRKTSKRRTGTSDPPP